MQALGNSRGEISAMKSEMRPVELATPRRFVDALVASGRAQELADVDDLFGFMIGSWDVEAVLHGPDGKTQKSRGEVHASWVLEGRAIQDLFIFPRRADRAAGVPSGGDRYGTTVKTYDRMRGGWRVEFINPAAPDTSAQLIARRSGQDIEMEGRLASGAPIRWHYRSITPTSFAYSAEKMEHGGWQLYLELFGTRADASGGEVVSK
jgi:hypothetical protein